MHNSLRKFSAGDFGDSKERKRGGELSETPGKVMKDINGRVSIGLTSALTREDILRVASR